MSEPSFVRHRWQSFPCAVAVALFLCVLAAFLVPAVREGRDEMQRAQCKNNMHAIVMALHAYHDDYGSFPPAWIADAQGRPMHSWRVLIFPYLTFDRRYPEFYEQYDFTEPWDGPRNSELAREFGPPRVFQCPADPGLAREGGGGDTSFVAIVGPHTCWPGEAPVAMGDITDGTSNTLLVVECHRSGIHWLEPRDLHVLQMARTINPAGGQGISGSHGGAGGAEVGAADDSGHFLSEKTDAEMLRRMIERDDGEPVDSF